MNNYADKEEKCLRRMCLILAVAIFIVMISDIIFH